MNKKQSNNLRKLADYLTTVDQNVFDMSFFRINKGGIEKVSCGSKDDCETIGYALRLAPNVEGLETVDSDYFYKRFGLNYDAYCSRLFGLGFCFTEWDWCFHSEWDKIDSSPTGSAKRIIELLDNDLPNNWMRQIYGKEPYMFADTK